MLDCHQLGLLPIDLTLALKTTDGHQEAFAELATTLTILLLVATIVALLSRRFRVPYVTGLVIAGLVITGFLPQRLGLDSALILNLFLPILLFQAAINTDISRLRGTIKPILVLAGPGVIIASGITALVLKFGLELLWVPALLAGVILAITDTVSVIAVFQEVVVPSRLSTIVEGESLFNDGVALVLFTLLTEVHITGEFSIVGGIQELLLVIIGGSLMGLIVGYLGAGIFSTQSEDPLSGILLTVAIAFGTYQVCQALDVSGVVGVVIAGLTIGNRGLPQSMSASSKITLLNFWEYASFCVNTFIFLLIGLEVEPQLLWRTLPAVLLAIVAYQIGRMLSVYPLLAIIQWFDRPIPRNWKHVLFLGNIKGSLSMVLALSLPATLPGRADLVTLIYGAVLLSLVVQGLSLPGLVKRLNIAPISESKQQIEGLQAQLITAKAAQSELTSLLDTGVLPKTIYEEMRSAYQIRITKAERMVRDMQDHRNTRTTAFNAGSDATLNAVRRRLLLVEKGALNEALRKRILSDEIVQPWLKSIDEQLLTLEED